MLTLTDSGVLLRLFEPNDPSHTAVRRAVEACDARGDELVTTPQNLAEFWNVCTRPATARGGFGLTVAQAEQRLKDVERKFGLLAEMPTTYPIWRSLVLTHAVLGKQVHDARLVAYMLSHGITHILTLNGSDFSRYPGITPLDPLTLITATASS